VDNNVAEMRTSVFGENANNVGAAYSLAVIMLVGLSMFKGIRAGLRWLVVPLVALVALAMAKTGSRTAFLVVAVGTVVLLLQAEAFVSRARRYVTLLLMGALLAGVVWQVPTVLDRFQHLGEQDVSRQEPRARMVPVLWEIFLRHPVLGSGPDRYGAELTRRAMPYMIHEDQPMSAHNLVLLLLVETGIIGFLVFGVGFGKALVAGWRARHRPCGYLPLALLLPVCVVGIVSADPTQNHIFWLAVAYALAGAA
jgi:O-antigen ligase